MSKAVTKAAGCGLSGDMISALHQHHSNMSQADFGFMSFHSKPTSYFDS